MATIQFTDGATASYSRLHGLDAALYTFDTGDTVLAQAAYFGQPERRAVTVSLGKPGDTSGYRLAGLTVGDWLLTGTVMCMGDDMAPQVHPQALTRYPLSDVTDPDVRDEAARLLADLARFHYGLIN